jgi:hypothetical protein
MKKQLMRVVALALGVAMLAAATASAGNVLVVRAGNLILKDSGGITPLKLPRHEQAPITADLHGEISTMDGTHPPAVRHLDVKIDRTIELDATGLPSCTLADVTARATAEAKRACPKAIIGSGDAEVEVEFPESEPFRAKGPIVVFNGGTRAGKTVLLIHTYVAVPAPTAVVSIAKVRHLHGGRFGLEAVVDIPAVAGGAGSATSFDLRLGRRFTFKGEQRSLITASCPTGSYRTEGKVSFDDGTKMELQHDLPCIPA